MFESADRGDLRRMGLLDETPFQIICTHCGSQNPEERRWSWRHGDQTIFACCDRRLVQEHGADPRQVIKQSPCLFGGDPSKMLAKIATALTR